ncbi:Leukocyte tyrosine kinase receptor, partial [Armadillidium nasatum]
IGKGASGGSGVLTQSFRTRGATAKAIFHLKKGEDVHVLVGQQGLSACQKDMPATYKIYCEKRMDPPEDPDTWLESTGVGRLNKLKNKTLPGGGGGGGGASFVFKKDGSKTIPLIVGAGGAGLAWANSASFTLLQHGRSAANESLPPVHGETLYEGSEGAGPGGGLEGKRESNTAGNSLQEGGEGGAPCSASWNAFGGFGGGGGGCIAGGGGGGYAGGNSDHGPYRHGEGGISFAKGLHPQVKPASNSGPGMVFIIPAVRNSCGCHHLCAHLDEHLNESVCLCTNNQILAEDGITCI